MSVFLSVDIICHIFLSMDMVQYKWVCQILFYIFVWSGLGFLIFVFVPLLISFWKPFPQYLLPLALLFEYLYLQIIIWSLYAPSNTEYFCGQNQDIETGTLDFLASNKCIIQAGFSFLFLFLSDCYTFILAPLDFSKNTKNPKYQ